MPAWVLASSALTRGTVLKSISGAARFPLLAAMVLLYALAPIAVPFLLLVVVLRKRPDVPKELNGWPSMGFVYLQLVRSALSTKKLGKKGNPIEVNQPARSSPRAFRICSSNWYRIVVGSAPLYNVLYQLFQKA